MDSRISAIAEFRFRNYRIRSSLGMVHLVKVDIAIDDWDRSRSRVPLARFWISRLPRRAVSAFPAMLVSILSSIEATYSPLLRLA